METAYPFIFCKPRCSSFHLLFPLNLLRLSLLFFLHTIKGERKTEREKGVVLKREREIKTEKGVILKRDMKNSNGEGRGFKRRKENEIDKGVVWKRERSERKKSVA